MSQSSSNRFAALAVFLVAATSTTAGMRAQTEFILELRNGMQIGPGIGEKVDSISAKASERVSPGNVNGEPIQSLNDGLRITFVNRSARNIIALRESTARASEKIILASDGEAAQSGNSPAILGVVEVTAFNKYGRRRYSFMTTRGQVDVLQGITVITPLFAKVEVLRTGSEAFVWDQRVITTSIPPKDLRAILLQAIDLNQSSEWLRLVSFYEQAERYSEAQEIMTEALEKFPGELADRAPIITQLNQLAANQKFEEIRLRQNSGQHELAKNLLGQFPINVLSAENQLKLDSEIKSLQQNLLQIADIDQSLKALVAKLPEPEQQVASAIADEISNEINFDSVVRLDDFQRLRKDSSVPVENLIAYAVGGWTLGSGSGLDNWAVAKSVVRVRELVQRYLTVATQAERAQILQELKGQEGAQPPLLAKIISTMKPPLAAAPHQAGDPQGLIRQQAQLTGFGPINYVVQLPPEYNPNRKYPCVLALPGKADSPELEINWWCGMPVDVSSGQYRFGQGTRYGYIVVSPAWMTDKQTEYEYTEGEHARILTCYRDALRRFSIDTDRVFIAGHYDGGTAAWDLASSHPDLWAGAIMVSPGADKHILHYKENLRTSMRDIDQIPLGTYIVYGDNDGTRTVSFMGAVATSYLSNPNYDCVAVQYNGEGRVRFAAELPRIVEWMELSSHRRIRAMRNIEFRTMRNGDRSFYWLEAPSIIPDLAGNAYQFEPKNFGVFDARLLDSAGNGVQISKIPSPNHAAIVWLTPEMVDFSRPITFINSGRKTVQTLEPDIEVMLEDVRRRGDRQHFFWQKVAL